MAKQTVIMVSVDEGERQVILLALAELALERPGWDYMLGELAERFQGRPMFDGFKHSNADRIVGIAAKLRKVASQCGAGGHTSRERMLNALADEFESEGERLPLMKGFGAGESKKGKVQKDQTGTPAPDAFRLIPTPGASGESGVPGPPSPRRRLIE